MPRAEAVAQAVLAQAPDDLQAHNGLGVAYDFTGQHEAAQEAYRAGLELAPDSMLLRNNLGLSLALSGQHAEGIELLRKVVDEPGAKARNRQNLALAYALAGDLVAAERISRLDLDEDAPRSALTPVDAVSVVGNLIDNALDAAASGTEPRWVRVRFSRAPDASLSVDVSDSGDGVPPAIAERIFEHGFSTKPADASGRGVGLALVRSIVESAGGSVRLAEAPTTFSVTLPARRS